MQTTRFSRPSAPTPTARRAGRGRWFALFVGTLAVAATGCGTQRIDDRANEQLVDARAQADNSVVYASCADGLAFGNNCGLVARYSATEGYRARFRASRCVGQSDEACNKLYAETIDRWMTARYQAADIPRITAFCDANPGQCDDLVTYEELLLNSNNENVRDRYARSVNAIEAEREQEKEAAVRRTTGVIVETAGAIDYAAHQGPKCRTYPSVSTGVGYAVCTR